MYETVEIWKRIGSGSVIRFQCLRRVSDGMFAVQNANFFRDPLSHSAIQASDHGFLELLLDDDPEDRCDWFSSVDEAVLRHERDFEGLPDNI